MTAASETTAIDIKVTGGDAGAAQYAKVADAAKKLEATNRISTVSFGKSAEQIAKFGSVLNATGPMLGTFGKAAAGAGQSLSLMTSIIGGGVAGGAIGAVAGGLVGAMSLLSSASDEATVSLEKVRSEAVKVLSLQDRIASITSGKEAADLEKRIASGAASSVEYEAKIAQAREGLAALQKGTPSNVISIDERRRAEAIKELEGRRQMALDREEVARVAADGQANGSIGAQTAKASAGPSPYGSQSEAAAQLDSVRRAAAEREEIYEGEMRLLEEMQKQKIANQYDADMTILEASRAASAQHVQLRREQAEEIARIEAELAKKAKIGQDVAIAGVKNLTSNTVSLAQKAAKGQKVSAKEFIAAIGDQAVADGTFRVLQGVAMLASSFGLNPAGHATIAAGSAEIAFGIGLGAAGTGGRERRLAREDARRDRARPAEPERPSEPYGGRERSAPRSTSNTINVQVDAMVADANAGRRISQAIQESKRVYGEPRS